MNKFCINIDWFEVFTYEPSDCDGAAWYEALGFVVNNRGYGTRVYGEMFTLIDKKGDPWLEVRRAPKSVRSQGGILMDGACSLRLVNRACYDWQPISDLYNFMAHLGFHYTKFEICTISRVDLCVDFPDNTFKIADENITCHEFIRRYMSGEWWKIGAAKTQAFGEEFSDGMHFHAIKFGSLTSMVNTKLYNKTLEMAQEKVKPWIIQSWVAAGIIENEDDTSPVWRLEFSIHGNANEWVAESYSPTEPDYIQQNTIAAYCNTSNYTKFIGGLIKHYFCFAQKDGSSKYRAPRFNPLHLTEETTYRPIHLQPKQKTSGRWERNIINALTKIRDCGEIESKFVPAINCTLGLLQTLYVNHAITRDKITDPEQLAKSMQDYDEKLIYGAFDSIIGDTSRQPEYRKSAELAWALFNRPLRAFARERWEKEPYSITAVGLTDPNITAEDKIAEKHLIRWLERHNMMSLLDEPDIPDYEWLAPIAKKYGLMKMKGER